MREEPGDHALAHDLLERLAENHVDYTLFFRRLCASAADPLRGAAADADILSLFDEPDGLPHLGRDLARDGSPPRRSLPRRARPR